MDAKTAQPRATWVRSSHVLVATLHPRPAKTDGYAGHLGFISRIAYALIVLALHSMPVLAGSSAAINATAASAQADHAVLASLDALYSAAIWRAHLAANKGSADNVRALGRKFADDVEAAQQAIRNLAKGSLTPDPAANDSSIERQRLDLEAMKQLSGRDFDRVFLERALRDQQLAVAMVKERLVPQAHSQDVKIFLESRVIPKLTQVA
jgi:predicted outer membrane protein